ncbi:hypothetical protein [Natrinema versiforme]|uniref:hypothetical protein n=1 Tax=Natrinema versiforme TaxID=88724 RepID=UPI0012694810|nr:hypothetical protein [Natrinema versiforme]
MRKKISPALGLAIGFTVFVGLVFGLSVVDQAGSDLEIDVVGAADPNGTGQVTEITVKVRNTGDQPVDPVFSVIGKSENNYNWVSNISRIPAGETTKATLNVKYIQQGIPQDTSFKVRVNDRENTARKALSGLYPNAVCEPAVKDSSFEYWMYDNEFGDQRPALWSLNVWRPGLEPNGSFTSQSGPNNGSAMLTVEAPNRETGTWTQASYAQSMTDVPDRLSVEFAPYSDSTVWRDGDRDGLPAEFVGVRFVDPTENKRIWLGYSENVDKRTTVHIEGDVEYVIILTPKQKTTISPASVYRERGWAVSDSYTLNAGVAAWPPMDNTSVISGFEQVTTHSCSD